MLGEGRFNALAPRDLVRTDLVEIRPSVSGACFADHGLEDIDLAVGGPVRLVHRRHEEGNPVALQSARARRLALSGDAHVDLDPRE